VKDTGCKDIPGLLGFKEWKMKEMSNKYKNLILKMETI
jgi:hypothetical protein